MVTEEIFITIILGIIFVIVIIGFLLKKMLKNTANVDEDENGFFDARDRK